MNGPVVGEQITTGESTLDKHKIQQVTKADEGLRLSVTFIA